MPAHLTLGSNGLEILANAENRNCYPVVNVSMSLLFHIIPTKEDLGRCFHGSLAHVLHVRQ